MTQTTPALDEASRPRSPLFRMSLSSAILLGMVLGILTGIFLGELAAPLGVIGDGFVKLLQMTILPYIVVALIQGIGSLSYAKAGLLVKKGGLLLLLYWAIAFVFILLIPLSFPSSESAAFFSTSLVEKAREVDFLELYIPANPFSSLANNFVPAVVLFALSMGVALIGIKDKEPFLHDMSILSSALVTVAGFVVKLTPLGVFAIAAAAAGTMTVDEFSRLQVYIISFTVACLILAFWVLPMMVAVATPFKYREIVGVSRDALVTAFTTGNLFVVLPILTEYSKGLFRKEGLTTEDTEAYVDVLIPVTFNFPNIGKLIMLVFILFGAWFSGTNLGFMDYIQFVFSGLLAFFGGVDVALPFMLNLMQMPADLYQLYIVTGIINGRTATLLAAMNLFTFTLLTVAALTGHAQIRWHRVLMVGLATLGIMVVALGGMRFYFATSVDNAYDKDFILGSMQASVTSADSVIHQEVPKDLVRRDPARPLLESIRQSGELRVGYEPTRLPFSFINIHGDLVGFDMDMARLLANELGVKLVLLPIDMQRFNEQLAQGEFDVAMSGIPVTTTQLAEMKFSEPYMNVNLAFMTRDYRAKEFSVLAEVKKRRGLRIGIVYSNDSYFFDKLVEAFPLAEIVELTDIKEFLEDPDSDVDALVTSAEGGSAWTLLYPAFTVVVPEPGTPAQPLAYPVAMSDEGMTEFLNGWIDLKRSSGSIQKFYDHWILGKDAVPVEPRWSVIRNVLHWVD